MHCIYCLGDSDIHPGLGKTGLITFLTFDSRGFFRAPGMLAEMIL